MPELPETETIARDLHAALRGIRIEGVEVTRPDVLRGVDASDLEARVAGRRIDRVWRRAKLVVLDLDSGERIVVQPRFTGALLLEGGDHGELDERERRYSTLAFQLDDGRRVHYRDIRRLGTVSLMGPERFAAYDGTLGPEPLDPAWGAGELTALLRSSRQPVKKVLMDQRRVVGIGNIYANEALWRAGVLPARPASSVTGDEAARLHGAIRSVLAESIELRGTSFRDYRDASGNRGRFAERLAVYGRGGERCLECGELLTESHEIDGRPTVWCARCQR